MHSLWRDDARNRLVSRLDRLTPDSTARWGRFSCPAMLAHVNDALRMPLGEVQPPEVRLPLRFFPLKQLVIYLMPFPRSAPTSPALLVRCGVAVLDEEKREFRELLLKLVAVPAGYRWPRHPAFGAMTRRSWGVLGYRHVDHHFRQFGV